MKKLDQVCEIVGMTKRVISQYEANGCAIVPKHKNKYGHILYGEEEIQRLCQIRLYRELGYTSKQIKERFSLDSATQKAFLLEQIDKLKQKIELYEDLLKIGTMIAEEEISDEYLFAGLPLFDTYEKNTKFVIKIFEKFNVSRIKNIQKLVDAFENTELDKIIDNFATLKRLGYSVHSDLAQEEAKKFVEEESRVFGSSMAFFVNILYSYAPDTDFSKNIDKEYGEGSGEYVYEAVKLYCENNPESEADIRFVRNLRILDLLYRKGYGYESKTTQKYVAELHEGFKNIKLDAADQLECMKMVGEGFLLDEMVELYEDAKAENQYIGNAILYYCNNYKNEEQE